MMLVASVLFLDMWLNGVCTALLGLLVYLFPHFYKNPFRLYFNDGYILLRYMQMFQLMMFCVLGPVFKKKKIIWSYFVSC